MTTTTSKRLLYGAIGFAGALALWWIFVLIAQPRPIILPAPNVVFDRLVDLWRHEDLIGNIGTSMLEFVLGFVPGLISGVIVGGIMAQSRLLYSLLNPPVEIFRVVIPFSLVPLAVVWFSTGISGKVFIVWYATIFVVIINTFNGMINVDPQLLRAGRMIGISPRALTWKVTLPAALPRILAGAQVAISIAWISVIAAEYIGASSGLGYLITNAQDALATDTVLAVMVVIGVIGSILSGIISTAERLSVPYKEKAGW